MTVQTRNTFRLEGQNLLYNFKILIIRTDVILYIRCSKSLRHCNSASWKHRRRRLTFLNTLKLSALAEVERSGWSWALWLKLSGLDEVERSGWSWALWMKLSALAEVERSGWSWALWLKLSALAEVEHSGWSWVLHRKLSTVAET
jgi:hypothetical protein